MQEFPERPKAEAPGPHEQEGTSELSAEATELHRLLGATAAAETMSETPVDDIDLPDDLPPQRQLFSSAEHAASTPDSDIELASSNKLDLLNKAQEMITPYRVALFDAMLSKAPDSKETVGPPPAYDKNPAAWQKYVAKKGKTITWEENSPEADYSFALTYLPLESGNRLAGFSSTTEEVKTERFGERRDRTVKNVHLTFSENEVIEASLRQHTSRGDRKIFKKIDDEREMQLAFYPHPHISDHAADNKKPLNYEYNSANDMFEGVGYTGKIKSQQALNMLSSILKVIPTITSE